jgi:hypothetical protein
MNFRGLVFAGAAFFAPEAVQAQQTVWREPVYAEVVRTDHGGDVESVPFYPYQWTVDPSSRVMRVSTAGTTGIVLAGSAQTGDGDEQSAPTTPYVTKLDVGDGHVLWTWQPDPVLPPQGRIWWSDIDTDGAIFVAGSVETDLQPPRSLLAKLDGATGAELWRVVGEPSTTSYMFAFDGMGSVVVTSSEPDDAGQRVAKYAVADGAPAWSHVITRGISWHNDFRLAVRADGDVFAAGSSADNSEGMGVEVVRLHASDGSEAWRYFTQDMSVLEEAQNVVVLDEDVLVASRAGRVRLAGDDGAVMWQQSINSADFRTFDVITDAAGRLFVAGSNHVDRTAVVRRCDPATGDALWEAVLSDSGDIASTWLVSIANDGSLLPAWYSNPVGAANVDAENGAVAWSRLLDPYPDGSSPVGIEQAPDGAIFVGTYEWSQGDAATWVVFKLVDVAADTIFENGFD